MKMRLIFAFIAIISATSVFAQKTQVPYTIWVYNTTSSCGQGTLLTSNAQLLANTTYIVKVRSSASPVAIRITLADGFETGLAAWCPFQISPTPTTASSDTGSSNNWTITFPIRTVQAPGFSSPVFMKIEEWFQGGTLWVNPQRVTFPY